MNGHFVRRARAGSGAALAQELPAGPPVAITMVTQLSPTIPQYTRVDIPMLREELPKRRAAASR